MCFVLMLLLIYLFTVLVIKASSFFFFFNDTATTEIYTLSLHDALPILSAWALMLNWIRAVSGAVSNLPSAPTKDRKSTRLNSSHTVISYAVFCLKKKTEHLHLQRQGEAGLSHVLDNHQDHPNCGRSSLH